MTDQQILAKLGLSEHEAADLAKKIASLNAAQIKALQGSSTDPEEAAESLGSHCTPADLQRFLSARQGISHGTAQIYYGLCNPEDDDKEE